MSEDNHEKEEEKMGYGNPPKRHWFKKGQSGNPRGRPKTNRKFVRRFIDPVHQLLWDIMGEPVPVTMRGRQKKVPAFKALFLKLRTEALQGKVSSQRFLLQLARVAGQTAGDHSLKAFAYLERYKSKWEPLFASAKENRRPEPTELPHPDHVDFSFEIMDVVVTGPETTREKAMWDLTKESLRSLDEQRIDLLQSISAGSRKAEDLDSVAEIEKTMKLVEKTVPKGWNWRECVTDKGRAYYSSREKRWRNGDGGRS